MPKLDSIRVFHIFWSSFISFAIGGKDGFVTGILILDIISSNIRLINVSAPHSAWLQPYRQSQSLPLLITSSAIDSSRPAHVVAMRPYHNAKTSGLHYTSHPYGRPCYIEAGNYQSPPIRQVSRIEPFQMRIHTLHSNTSQEAPLCGLR